MILRVCRNFFEITMFPISKGGGAADQEEERQEESYSHWE